MPSRRVAVELSGGKPTSIWHSTEAGLAEQHLEVDVSTRLKRLAAAFIPEGIVSEDYFAFQVQSWPLPSTGQAKPQQASELVAEWLFFL